MNGAEYYELTSTGGMHIGEFPSVIRQRVTIGEGRITVQTGPDNAPHVTELLNDDILSVSLGKTLANGRCVLILCLAFFASFAIGLYAFLALALLLLAINHTVVISTKAGYSLTLYSKSRNNARLVTERINAQLYSAGYNPVL